MKKSVFTLLLVLFTFHALAQEVPELNAYKYAIVETIFYDNTPDEFGVSATVRTELAEMGIEVTAENKEAWPADLKANPCLGLWVKLDAPRRSLGRKRVTLSLQDCKGKELYTHEDYGNAPTLAEAYQYAAKQVVKPIIKAGYVYEPAVAIAAEPEQREGQTVADFGREYMAVAGREPIEGLYTTEQEEAPASIFVKAQDDRFVILDTRLAYAEAQPMGQLAKSTLPGVYKINWKVGEHSFRSTAVINEGKIIIEWINADDSVIVVSYTPF